jgi:hypothetical protein
LAKRAALKARCEQQDDDGNATDVDQASLPEDVDALPKHSTVRGQQKVKASRKPSCTDSIASTRSEIPVIKISKECDEGIRVGSGKGTSSGPEHSTPAPPGSTSAGAETPAPTSAPTRRERVLKALLSRTKKVCEFTRHFIRDIAAEVWANVPLFDLTEILAQCRQYYGTTF